MRRGKQKVRLSTSVTEIGEDNAVRVVRKTKRASAGRRKPDKDPLALPSRRSKVVKTKAARKQPAEPEEYEVEKIIGHKQIGRDVTYRIRWKGWGSKDDTRQAEEDLNCEAILDKYKASIRPLSEYASSSSSYSPKSKKSGSPKKRGRPSLKELAAAAKSPKKKGVKSGKVEKKRGRPSLKGGSSPAKKKAKKPSTATGKKRGRKPKADTEWEVEEIVAVRTTEAGKEEFYVKWKGYSSDDNTWEPADNVGNSADLIERFKATQGDSPSKNGDGGEDDAARNGTEDDEEEDDQPLATATDDTQDESVDN